MIRVLAQYSFRELVRERFVHIMLFISLVIFLFSFLLGSMSLEEQSRIFFDFGSLAIHLSVLGMGLLLGSSRVVAELDRQTGLLLLARPISRADFMIGKWLGNALVLFIVSMGLSVVLFALMRTGLQAQIDLFDILKMTWGIFLESTFLMTLTLAFSLVVRPSIAFFFGVVLFLLGNWLPDLEFFAQKSGDEGFQSVAKIVKFICPQLYRMNWRSTYLMDQHLPSLDEIFWVSIHGAGWIVLAFVCALILFRRKDLV